MAVWTHHESEQRRSGSRVRKQNRIMGSWLKPKSCVMGDEFAEGTHKALRNKEEKKGISFFEKANGHRIWKLQG